MRYETVYAKNRPSPLNEEDYINAYKSIVPLANRPDDYDISAVITQYGFVGHAMMYYSDNRSKDNQYHLCKYFVSDDELRNYM